MGRRREGEKEERKEREKEKDRRERGRAGRSKGVQLGWNMSDVNERGGYYGAHTYEVHTTSTTDTHTRINGRRQRLYSQQITNPGEVHSTLLYSSVKYSDLTATRPLRPGRDGEVGTQDGVFKGHSEGVRGEKRGTGE
ncbi:hypothetical protein V502_10371 [Pseudogymnoascus sp. VKM F-4520 (FW-2644)]|nr:hypothetical protein V502_10371 [Pseudogymnoascus sp. VKM F-4520 (FW-2644)]